MYLHLSVVSFKHMNEYGVSAIREIIYHDCQVEGDFSHLQIPHIGFDHSPSVRLTDTCCCRMDSVH